MHKIMCCGIVRHCLRAQWGVHIFGTYVECIRFHQTTTGASFHTDIQQWSVSLPENWVSTTKCDEQCLRISKLENLPLSTSPPVHILLTVTISIDGDWSVHACGKQLTPHNCKVLEDTPTSLTPADLAALNSSLDSVFTCPGKNDEMYCELA